MTSLTRLVALIAGLAIMLPTPSWGQGLMEEMAKKRTLESFNEWRKGEVVATAKFDPGIAPFTIEVRKVPVPVTNSYHFIVSLGVVPAAVELR